MDEENVKVSYHPSARRARSTTYQPYWEEMKQTSRGSEERSKRNDVL